MQAAATIGISTPAVNGIKSSAPSTPSRTAKPYGKTLDATGSPSRSRSTTQELNCKRNYHHVFFK